MSDLTQTETETRPSLYNTQSVSQCCTEAAVSTVYVVQPSVDTSNQLIGNG